ncbi:MAG: hypothetical protein O3A00_01840 [Planctomycetota bacterium]|nr:hypothetical protein [Planctomycetota bacterium]
MAQNSNRKSLLGDLVDYAKALQLDPRRGLVHQVLGKGGDDARAEHLVNTYEVADSDSEVHGNGIASNGVMLPVTFDRPSQRLIGKLRVPPAADALLTFVKAPWPEIEPAFRRINESSGHEDELLMTNGRFNHLWNNMFHHLRNDYVNERYPEDMPGTIVELNPDWAATRNIKNGDVVEISGVSAGSTGQCRAVASLQDSVPPTCGFAMFSYPARDTGGRRFVLDGYINRTTDGYTDGINPIAALKYGRVIVRATGTSYASQTRSGPTYAQRNRIRPQNVMPRRIDSKARREWMMRELIVKKGLPQAFLRRPFDFAGNTPHQATSLAGEPSTGRFWRELDVSPSEFLALEIEGESVQSELVARLNSDLPSGMLPPATEPHTPNDTARVDRIQQLLAGTFGEAEFDELRNLLDDFLDRPHRVIEQLFLDPDAFLAKLNAADAVREQFAMRLNPSDDRTMIWRDATGVVIDQWISSERDIAFSWLNGDTMPNRKPSFRLHIRPMFTDNDISSMNPWFDLSNLEDVKANAAGIVERLEDKDLGRVMPPRPDRGTGPWPEEWIRLFKRWVSEGFPE